ncbi:MAG: alpha-ketoacid dehydrogenase subunit beta [Myxococcota bacterium]
MREIFFSQAINEAMRCAMAQDPSVILIGEDIAGGAGREEEGIEEAWGGIMGATKGLYKEFGPDRVLDTPISESGFVGAAVGAATTGLRPVVELMFMDFLGVSLDPLLNQAAKLRYMFGGKARVPMTVRTLIGAGVRAGAQHSQCLYGLTTAIPGLKTVVPSCPADAKGLLLASIRDDDPVIFCEHKGLYFTKGPCPEGDVEVPLGKADVKRAGEDVTVVAVGKMVGVALDAAQRLSDDEISVEVVDPRTLSPLDEETLLSSLEKTGRLVVVDESTPRCSFATDVAALAADRGFDLLDAPIKRVTAPHSPVPFSPVLEDAFMPGPERVMSAIREVLE